ncbi:MAG TPA: hypothetical protein VN673_18925 [Clostridia bacterium]|nr:hypothetical protein [Clostridia bacterium]
MRSSRLSHSTLLFIMALLAGTLHGFGQWTSQTLALQPGWNAVFLEVQPEPRECDAVFAGLPVETAWRWNRRFNPVEFIQDPSALVPAQPDWLVYFSSTNPITSQSSLFTVEGGRPYLIKLADNASPTNWVVIGKAVVRKVEWLSDSMNFVGFNVPTNNVPNFQTFFSGSSSHSNQLILRLNAQGRWQTTAATTGMRRGEGFWIRCNGRSEFQGPLSVTMAKGNGLDYGRVSVEQTVKIRNNGTAIKTVQLRKLNSATAPVGVTPALAGQVPLNYWKFDVLNNVAGWTPLPSTLSSTLSPGQEWELRLEVRRPEMSQPAGTGESLYQSLLEITDITANSSRLTIPVVAEGMQQIGAGAPNPRAGLWVGSAEITHVSQPSSDNPNNPVPVASSYQFRLLVHVDGNGQAKLLQKVLQMWKPGTYRTNENGIREVDQPGRFVLVTDDNLIPNFTGSALRDGEPVARRFSTAAFGFRTPIAMTGTGPFGTSGSQFACNVVLDYDDALNPFKHVYHPDHDNWDARYSQKLPEGKESFSVTRAIQLQFTSTDPDNSAIAGWGDNQLGGIYGESIGGLHRDTLTLRGSFRLQQAVRTAALNSE